jgi:hypothetical protein
MSLGLADSRSRSITPTAVTPTMAESNPIFSRNIEDGELDMTGFLELANYKLFYLRN